MTSILQSDILLNTRMGTVPNVASTMSNLQIPLTNSVQTQDPVSSIFQDYDRNEASRNRVTSDQRSSVYIGQVMKGQSIAEFFFVE